MKISVEYITIIQILQVFNETNTFTHNHSIFYRM
jgi:hypothetical protein